MCIVSFNLSKISSKFFEGGKVREEGRGIAMLMGGAFEIHD
jgi:hypothetical protein